jgi:[acyl-carrier-protein] S-malonyltransferase
MSIGFVFPGQGSQSLGMQASYAGQPAVRDCYAEASAVLGYDLWALAQDGPAEQLNATEHTQPLMLTAGVATYRLWLARGGQAPVLMAGHSLGEFTALVCAGSLQFADAVALVRRRAQLMQAAVPAGTGAMAAILGLDDADVEAACAEAAGTQVVEPVNYNQPGQLVIAGHAAAVERAMAAAKARGAKRCVLLPVSVPAHSSLLAGAAARFAEAIAAVPVAVPLIPVLGIGASAHASAEAVRAGVVEQLHRPVRWTSMVQAMVGTGIGALVECGPGKVLAGLIRRIERNKDFGVYSTDDEAALAAALAATSPAAPHSTQGAS